MGLQEEVAEYVDHVSVRGRGAKVRSRHCCVIGQRGGHCLSYGVRVLEVIVCHVCYHALY